jgi:uncharacterized protein YecE (DUF72 family)
MRVSGEPGCILALFPYSFHPTPESRAYLRRLSDGLGTLPTVVDFRNAGWVMDETLELLLTLGLHFTHPD